MRKVIIKMKKNDSLEKIREEIKNTGRIAVAGHTNPDGDAIGACLGLALSLVSMGKDVSVFLEKYTEKYDFVPGGELLIYESPKNLKFDLFISLDCGDRERLGTASLIAENIKIINIDHHISNMRFGNLNYIEPEASSTSELIFKLIDGFMPLNKEIALALYVGILNDTGGFRHSNVSPYTLQVASNLLTYDIPASEVYNKLFHKRTFQEAKAMGKALENAKTVLNGKVIYSYLTAEEISNCGISYKQLDGVVEYLKGVIGTEVSVFLYERSKNEIKLSIRSEDSFNAAEFAQSFGGGGHEKAAGATLGMTMEDALKAVMDKIIISLEKGD